MATTRVKLFNVVKLEVAGTSATPQRIAELPAVSALGLWSALAYSDLPPLDSMPKIDGTDHASFVSG